ncbi:MAG: type II toxin-antitoxin system VapB family antitoxin [Pseudomonadota bacterium]
MALNIKSHQADRLARELAALAGESMTAAITKALAERLERLKRTTNPARREALQAIRERAAKIKPRDRRSADEIVGYDGEGTFG